MAHIDPLLRYPDVPTGLAFLATYSALSIIVTSSVPSAAEAATAVSSGASPGGALLSGILLIFSLSPRLAAAAIMTAACFLVRGWLSCFLVRGMHPCWYRLEETARTSNPNLVIWRRKKLATKN